MKKTEIYSDMKWVLNFKREWVRMQRKFEGHEEKIKNAIIVAR